MVHLPHNKCVCLIKRSLLFVPMALYIFNATDGKILFPAHYIILESVWYFQMGNAWQPFRLWWQCYMKLNYLNKQTEM